MRTREQSRIRRWHQYHAINLKRRRNIISHWRVAREVRQEYYRKMVGDKDAVFDHVLVAVRPITHLSTVGEKKKQQRASVASRRALSYYRMKNSRVCTNCGISLTPDRGTECLECRNIRESKRYQRMIERNGVL